MDKIKANIKQKMQRAQDSRLSGRFLRVSCVNRHSYIHGELFIAAKGRERWQFDGIAGLSTQQLCQHLAFLPGPMFRQSLDGTVYS